MRCRQMAQQWLSARFFPTPVSSPSTTGRLTDFRVALRRALDRLKCVGAIKDWSIDPGSDLVSVKRRPSPSQDRFLGKKVREKATAAVLENKNDSLDGF